MARRYGNGRTDGGAIIIILIGRPFAWLGAPSCSGCASRPTQREPDRLTVIKAAAVDVGTKPEEVKQ